MTLDRDELIRELRQRQSDAFVAERPGPEDRRERQQELDLHIDSLAEAVEAREPRLFADHVDWARVTLEARGLTPTALLRNLQILQELLRERAPEALPFLAAGLASLSQPRRPDSPLPANPLQGLASRFTSCLLEGDRQVASQIVQEAMADGATLQDVYLHIFQSSQHEIGRLWQRNRISVAQEHYCTAATQLIMAQLYPLLFATPKFGKTLVSTCVAGDLHEIGARMISDFFEMEGWDTFYLGANVPSGSVVETLKHRAADCLAISATLTAHVGTVRSLIQAVRRDPQCQQVRVLVGGHPFNVAPDLWREVGADGWARDAREALKVAAGL